MRIPKQIEDITAEWIDEALRAGGAADLPPVHAVRTRVIGPLAGS